MIELISLLGGGLMRLLPELFKLFTAKRDADHEFRMTQMQLEIDKARAAQAIDLAHTQGGFAADAADTAAMIEALKGQGAPSGIGWVDAVSATVRPVLTYWWCLLLYTANKVILVVVGLSERLPLAQFAPLVLNDFDRAVVGSIIGFWFADRAIRRTGRG